MLDPNRRSASRIGACETDRQSSIDFAGRFGDARISQEAASLLQR
jgi:hypothetical protein